MNKINGKQACQQAIRLIETQLQVLPLVVVAIVEPAAGDGAAAPLALSRKGLAPDAGTRPPIALDLAAATQELNSRPHARSEAQRIVIGNMLLAVDAFLKVHDIASSRTPAIQFLGHVCEAIVNDNVLAIDPGHIPAAAFDGLVIDETLNGTLLFGDGVRAGLMEFGDAVALLEWIARHLRGEKKLVTGGDAG